MALRVFIILLTAISFTASRALNSTTSLTRPGDHRDAITCITPSQPGERPSGALWFCRRSLADFIDGLPQQPLLWSRSASGTSPELRHLPYHNAWMDRHHTCVVMIDAMTNTDSDVFPPTTFLPYIYAIFEECFRGNLNGGAVVGPRKSIEIYVFGS